VIDAYLFLGQTPRRIINQYTNLTGTTDLPPYFSLAYHQCRWDYESQEDVANVDQGFDAHDIPYDVMWLDIGHTNEKQYFTWDPKAFSDPAGMIRNLASKQRKLVTIVDPHIKIDPNYYVYKEATEKDFLVKTKDNTAFEGKCWPGPSHWIDYSNPKAREWWASKFDFDQHKFSTPDVFTWNDMNEPSVFGGEEGTFPKDLIQYGNWNHRDLHNTYGFYQAMASAQGSRKRNNQRAFVLTRSFFAGSQRNGPAWTGDNTADWDYLKLASSMILSLGISGYAFTGADVAGFAGEPDAELFVRWYEAGTFHPFFRGHSMLHSERREPWLKGEPYTSHIRNSIKIRYHLLPLWYTLAHEAHIQGSPMIRPLFFEFPEDRSLVDTEDEFLVGNHLLVKPVTQSGVTETQVYLPGSNQIWYDYNTFANHMGPVTVIEQAPLDKIPVFIKGGAVIPRKERVGRSSGEGSNDPYSIWVALDSKGQASGDIYLDDGISLKHKEGVSSWKLFTFKDHVVRSQNMFATVSQYDNQVTIERLSIIGMAQVPILIVDDKGEKFPFVAIPQAGAVKRWTIVVDVLNRLQICKNWAVTFQMPPASHI